MKERMAATAYSSNTKRSVLSATLDDELEALAQVGPYDSPRAVMAHALEVLLTANPTLRVDMALALWQQGKITFSRAVELAQIGRTGLLNELKARGLHIEIAPDEESIHAGQEVIKQLRRVQDSR